MWYSVKVVFMSELDHDDGQNLYDESIWLFNAIDEQEARSKAQDQSSDRAVDYENIYGEVVRWSFVKIDDVQEIEGESIEDGVEVYSRMYWEPS